MNINYLLSQVNLFLKLASSNINTNLIKNGSNKKFITNNFYNSNLIITGNLNAINYNNLSSKTLKEELIPKIGPLTTIVESYQVNKLNTNLNLSNIDFSYSYNYQEINAVPFIVIDNKVGILNANPRYTLDVTGTTNSSELLIKGTNISNIYLDKDGYFTNADLLLYKYNIVYFYTI